MVEVGDTLAAAYLAFETSFDSFKILPVYGGVRMCLFYLFQRARNLTIESPIPNQESNA